MKTTSGFKTAALKLLNSALLLWLSSFTAATAPRLHYDVTLIPQLQESYNYVPRAINLHGDVVGSFYLADAPRPFLYRNATLTVWDAGYGQATDINDAGEIVMAANHGGYLIKPDGQRILLQTEAGQPVHPHGLNNWGEVVGNIFYAGSGPFSAVSWSNGIVRRLGPISDIASLALDINASGFAAGTIYELPPSPFSTAALLWHGGLARLGPAGPDEASLAQALNDEGEVVINSPREVGWAAYLYTRGRTVNLGLLRHHNSIYGFAINNKGHVVGFSQNDHEQRAFLYANGELHDLNRFISPRHALTLQGAYAINDREQIVGIAQPRHGPPRAFILTPIKGKNTLDD